MKPAILAIDVGTGSARAGVVDLEGTIRALHAVAHETRYPHHGWVEQAPEVWWQGTCQAIRQVLNSVSNHDLSLQAVVSCGQTHAPIMLDSSGNPVTEFASLWNDKRADKQAEALRARPDYAAIHETTGNPAAPSWPGIKLAWYKENRPDLLDAASVVLMPKDFVNFRLSDETGGDRTEAGYSYLYSCRTGDWDQSLCDVLGIPRGILPELLGPDEQVGSVTLAAESATGLKSGLPVIVGAGDYPAAVLGSAVVSPGQCSDITGTSSLLSIVTPNPLIHADVMNAAAATGGWLAFSILDAAGDAVRWGRRELEDGEVDLTELTRRAAAVHHGSGGLLFMPFLTGERLGQGPYSRAAFLGLTAAHGRAHMHRAITEGVAMALKHAALPQLSQLGTPDAIVSAGGGAYSDLLLRVKASVFGVPFLPVRQVECGLLGGAALAFAALGHFSNPTEAAQNLVKFNDPIEPDPLLENCYAEQFDLFCRARTALQGLYSGTAWFEQTQHCG